MEKQWQWRKTQIRFYLRCCKPTNEGNFNQYTSDTFDKTANVDFSMKMGDGTLASSAYDSNGNIISMTQNGLKLNTSPVINQLTYEYKKAGTINTNKLIKVSDSIVASDNCYLGDFKDGANGSEGYDYDPNGNLIFDNSFWTKWYCV